MGKTGPKLTERQFIEKSIKEFREYGTFDKIRGGGSLRGLPDYVGVIEGCAVFLEYKRDISGSKKDKKGRTPLQEYRLQKYRDEGAFAEFIYPQNHDQILRDCLVHCGVITL